MAATKKKAGSTRSNTISETLQAIEKDYGKEAVIQLGPDERPQVEGISTGSLSIDLALGGKGLPRGRVIEIYGPEGSGKSTLAMQVVAQAQRENGFAVFVDAEHAFDPEYAEGLGVDLDSEKLTLVQPNYGEQALDIVEKFVKSNSVDVVVVDSVAALVPKAEIDGEIGDQFVGLQARMMSQALRRLTTSIGKTRSMVVFINQLREKIGVMFGNPETTPGGRALKFYSSVRMDVRRIGQLKSGEKIIGNRTKVTVVKNKVGPPFRRAEFDMYFGEGISGETDIIDLGLQHGIVLKSGAWFSYADPDQGEVRLGQGKEAARQLLKDNPDLMARIKELVLLAMAPPPAESIETKPASKPKAKPKAAAAKG